jgi:hypothetical protein
MDKATELVDKIYGNLFNKNFDAVIEGCNEYLDYYGYQNKRYLTFEFTPVVLRWDGEIKVKCTLKLGKKKYVKNYSTGTVRGYPDEDFYKNGAQLLLGLGSAVFLAINNLGRDAFLPNRELHLIEALGKKAATIL